MSAVTVLTRCAVATALLASPAVLNGGRSFSSGYTPGLKTRPPNVLAQDPKTTVASLLAAYDAGQYDVVDRTLAAEPKAPLADALRNTGDRWVKAGPAAQLDRRRMVAAAVALEIVAAGLTEEWYEVADAIEWACGHVRDTARGSPAELWWHLGSIALLQDGSGILGTMKFASDHVTRHSPGRLPKSDRVRFGKTIEEERGIRTPAPRRAGMPEVDPELIARSNRLAQTTIETYTALSSSPDVGEEASLRLGALYVRLGSLDKALAALAPVSQSSDVFVGHVASFLIGEALRQLGRNAEAAAAYREALTRVPGAMSASIGLSAALVAIGDMDRAITSVGPAATAAAPVDPWRVFAYGEGRHWPRWRDNLRKAIRP